MRLSWMLAGLLIGGLTVASGQEKAPDPADTAAAEDSYAGLSRMMQAKRRQWEDAHGKLLKARVAFNPCAPKVQELLKAVRSTGDEFIQSLSVYVDTWTKDIRMEMEDYKKASAEDAALVENARAQLKVEQDNAEARDRRKRDLEKSLADSPNLRGILDELEKIKKQTERNQEIWQKALQYADEAEKNSRVMLELGKNKEEQLNAMLGLREAEKNRTKASYDNLESSIRRSCSESQRPVDPFDIPSLEPMAPAAAKKAPAKASTKAPAKR